MCIAPSLYYVHAQWYYNYRLHMLKYDLCFKNDRMLLMMKNPVTCRIQSLHSLLQEHPGKYMNF